MNVSRLKNTLATIGLLIVFNIIHAQTDIIINRYRQYLINSVQPETDIKQAIASFSINHQWPDINYNDTARANWQVLNHLKRVRDLALAWTNLHSVYYGRNNIKETIHSGLDHWLDKRYKNSNWWHNEIGVPQLMRDIIVLFKKELSTSELDGALQVMAQFRVQENGVGANLTWSADLGFHYGIFTGNEMLMEKCRQLLINEIHFTTGDGVQPDYSFHQHGARLQMYQYGAAFLKDNVRIAWELLGTKWSYPPEKIKLLVDFVVNGWQWMARGMNTVPGTMDRSCTRKGALHNADLRTILPYLSELYPEKVNAFHSILRCQNNAGASLKGFRYYPYSDFSVYQQKDFSFFLKTISTRTLPTESINNENLKGQLLNSGDAYIIKNGKEYFDLMPGWDWNKLPGVTGFEGASKINRKEFVGSVTDGESGLTAMDFCLQGNEKQIFSARKIWACHAGVVVCLIADADSLKREGNIFTTLDQCRWQGDAMVNAQGSPLREGHNELNNIKWLYHAGVGYIFLKPAAIDLDIKKVTGTWKSINASESVEPVTEKIFIPVLKHLQEKEIGYVLGSRKSSAEIKNLANKPSWKILRNDKDGQAVSFADGTTMIAFFSPSSIMIGKHYFSIDQPCLALIKNDKIYLSNPAQGKMQVTVEYDHSSLKIQLPENGYSSSAILLNYIVKKSINP